MLALLKISGRIVWSALLSIPFALMITWAVDIITNQLNVRIDWMPKYEGWIGLAAFFLSLVACTHWVLRTHNRHLAISRGLWLICRNSVCLSWCRIGGSVSPTRPSGSSKRAMVMGPVLYRDWHFRGRRCRDDRMGVQKAGAIPLTLTHYN